MTHTELTTAVKNLQQYLLDVWELDEVFRIAHSMNLVERNSKDDRDYHETQYRELAEKLEHHLFTRYQQAIQETNRVLETVLSVEGGDILVERLKTSIAGSVNSAEGEPKWLQLAMGPLDMYANASMDSLPDTDAIQWGLNLWSMVRGDMSFYIGKVVSEIDRRLQTDPNDTAMRHAVRINWKGSASELAFLLTELVEAGYLVPPPIGKKTGKDGNRAAIADAILNAFDIRKKNVDPVSPAYFRSLMRPDSPDRGEFPQQFRIRPRSASK